MHGNAQACDLEGVKGVRSGSRTRPRMKLREQTSEGSGEHVPGPASGHRRVGDLAAPEPSTVTHHGPITLEYHHHRTTTGIKTTGEGGGRFRSRGRSIWQKLTM